MLTDINRKEIDFLIDYYYKQVALGLEIDNIYDDIYIYSLDLEKREVILVDILDTDSNLEITHFVIPDIFEKVEATILGNFVNSKIKSLDLNNVKSCKAVLSSLIESVKSDIIEELPSTFIFHSMLKDFNFKSLKKINDYCFYICCQLESIDLRSVKQIGNYCFNKCSLLKEIHLENIESIGYFCFEELYDDFKLVFHNKTDLEIKSILGTEYSHIRYIISED